MDNNNNNQYNPSYDTSEVYKTVTNGRRKSRGWSVAALVLSIISIVCCCYPIIGLTCAAVALVCAIVSRKSLGYFDGLTIAALICAIFGLVFGIFTIISDAILMSNPEFKQWYDEYMKQFEQMQQ